MPERAAAPKAVTVLDMLPVTDVGKPYKLALRADATRRELADALQETTGVCGIVVEIGDGSIVATVNISSPGDEAAVKAVLGRYSIAWRVEMTS